MYYYSYFVIILRNYYFYNDTMHVELYKLIYDPAIWHPGCWSLFGTQPRMTEQNHWKISVIRWFCSVILGWVLTPKVPNSNSIYRYSPTIWHPGCWSLFGTQPRMTEQNYWKFSVIRWFCSVILDWMLTPRVPYIYI